MIKISINRGITIVISVFNLLRCFNFKDTDCENKVKLMLSNNMFKNLQMVKEKLDNFMGLDSKFENSLEIYSSSVFDISKLLKNNIKHFQVARMKIIQISSEFTSKRNQIDHTEHVILKLTKGGSIMLLLLNFMDVINRFRAIYKICSLKSNLILGSEKYEEFIEALCILINNIHICMILKTYNPNDLDNVFSLLKQKSLAEENEPESPKSKAYKSYMLTNYLQFTDLLLLMRECEIPPNLKFSKSDPIIIGLKAFKNAKFQALSQMIPSSILLNKYLKKLYNSFGFEILDVFGIANLIYYDKENNCLQVVKYETLDMSDYEIGIQKSSELCISYEKYIDIIEVFSLFNIKEQVGMIIFQLIFISFQKVKIINLLKIYEFACSQLNNDIISFSIIRFLIGKGFIKSGGNDYIKKEYLTHFKKLIQLCRLSRYKAENTTIIRYVKNICVLFSGVENTKKHRMLIFLNQWKSFLFLFKTGMEVDCDVETELNLILSRKMKLLMNETIANSECKHENLLGKTINVAKKVLYNIFKKPVTYFSYKPTIEYLECIIFNPEFRVFTPKNNISLIKIISDVYRYMRYSNNISNTLIFEYCGKIANISIKYFIFLLDFKNYYQEYKNRRRKL